MTPTLQQAFNDLTAVRDEKRQRFSDLEAALAALGDALVRRDERAAIEAEDA